MRFLPRYFGYLLIALIFTAQTSLSAQVATEEASEPPANQVEDVQEAELEGAVEIVNDWGHEAMQKSALDLALQRWQLKFDLDQTIVDKLKESLEDDLKKVAERLDAQQNESFMLGTSQLDRELREAGWAELKNSLADDQLTQFDEWKESQRKLDNLTDHFGQVSVVILLDQHLSLNQAQQDKFLKILGENWRPSWNEGVAMMSMNGFMFGQQAIDTIKEGIADDEELLSTAQLTVLADLEEYGNSLQSIQMAVMGGNDETEWDADDFKSKCNTLVELKINEIKELCDLDEKQVKMLQIGRKGAVSKVAGQWQEMSGKFEDMMNAPMPDLKLMSLATEPLLSQVIRQNVWNKTLEKVLNDEQLQKVQSREEGRLKSAKEAMLNSVVGSILPQISGELEFDYDQHTALTEMLSEELVMTHSADYFGAVFGLFKVPDEKFEAILTEEQWESLSTQLEQQRQMVEQMEGDSNDEEED